MKVNNLHTYPNNYTNKQTSMMNNKKVAFGSLGSNAEKVVDEAANINFVKKITQKIHSTIKKANNKATELTNKALGPILLKASDTKLIKSLVNWYSKQENGYTKLLFADSVILSSFYMISTAKNKDMKKEQKMPLIVNQGLVFLISAAGTFFLDKIIKDKVKEFTTEFKRISKSADPKKIERITKGISEAQTIIVFGLIYRFIAPVVITPIANKVSQIIKKNRDAKKAELAKA